MALPDARRSNPPPRPPFPRLAGDGVDAPNPASHPTAVPLSTIFDDLDRVIASADGKPISLAQIEHALKGRGVAILLLVLAVPSLIPIPVPLLGAVIALPMMVVGLRIAISRDARLPRSLRDRQVSPESLARASRLMRRILKPVAWLFRPRLGIMFWIVPWHLTGVGIAVAAGVLCLPLPIPFTNTLPALALIHYGIGLLQRDGIALCVAHGFTVGSLVYLYFVWEKAVEILQTILH